MIVDRRRIIGSFAVFGLVVLRLVIGWHFFGEGTKKIQYDRTDGGFHLAFSADTELLDKAKGPLADWYFALCARRARLADALGDATGKRAADCLSKRLREPSGCASTTPAGRRLLKRKSWRPVEFAPTAPYRDWANKIAADWQAVLEKVKRISGFTDAQKQQADKALHDRLETLSDYLDGEEEGITTYRHELYRLKNWRDEPEAKSVPFVQSRITTKNTETNGQLKAWRTQIAALDTGYYDDLGRVLTPEQRKQASAVNDLNAATYDRTQLRLDKLNVASNGRNHWCRRLLAIGFLTRIASIVGVLFLLGVIASQPFWIAESVPTINQCIECAGLLVLAGTGAGRWFGLDYLTYAFFHRSRRLRFDSSISKELPQRTQRSLREKFRITL